MKEFWNERYSAEEFAYGTAANSYFATKIQQLEPGRLFCPAEGEGRNAVFAASLGWQVDACDLSSAGREKCMQLAQEKAVHINYQVGDFGSLNYAPESFDAVAMIFSHFPTELKAPYYTQIGHLLKKGAHLIVEVFSKKHLGYRELNPKVGGPADEAMLYSVEEIQSYFPTVEFEELQETLVDLSEGLYHIGQGSVIRAFGKKL